MKLCAIVVSIACPIASFISLCDAATFLTPIAIHPDHPGKCWHKDTKTAVKPYQTLDLPNQCVQLTCMKNLRFGGVGCIPQETPDDCDELPGNLTKPYPDCCPKFRCTDSNGKVNIFRKK